MINLENWKKTFSKNKCTETEEKECIDVEEKGSNPEKPLGYFELIEDLKKKRKNPITGKFPVLNAGQFKVSLQPGRNRRGICSNSEEGTLAEYLDFEFSVIDKNVTVNIHKDKRFENMPYRDFYYSTDKHDEKVIINFNNVFEMISYIEKMDVYADSYRNKKYYMKINTTSTKVEFIEATDSEVRNLMQNHKFNSIDIKPEKFVGLYEADKSNYILVRKQYRFNNNYNYYALYPKEIEDIIDLSIYYELFHYEMFPENIKCEIIKTKVKVFQSKDKIYKKDPYTWINKMQGEFFDCSANQLNLNDWIARNKGLSLALYITEEGRVQEIYGDRDRFLTRLSSMEQNKFNMLGTYNERRYVVQHYNWNPNPKCINKYIGNGKIEIYDDAIVMCEENGKVVPINDEDIKQLFDCGYIDESLKKHLLVSKYSTLFDEGYMKKAEKNSELEKNKIIDTAKSLDLADGIYELIRFNERASVYGEAEIDIYEVFTSESKESVDSWIYRVHRLLRDNYDVGDKLISRVHQSNYGDKESYDIADKKYEEAYLDFITNNPGFSEKTYLSAVNLGAQKAR